MTEQPASDPTFRRHVMGCAALAGLYRAATDAQAEAALAAAWDGGVRAFDTAPHYGVGLSEQRLGAFITTKPRDQYVISTKVGRLLVEDPEAVDGTALFYGTPKRSRIQDYSAAGVRRSHADSLSRLGLDRIDLLLVHDPEDHMSAALGEAVPELARMRDAGTIGGFGVGTNFVDVALEFVQRAPIDHVMIAGRYSLLDRRAERTLLDECAGRDIAVLVAGVFNSGLLADPVRRSTFNYGPAPTALRRAALAMEAACERHGVTLRAAALQFPLRHPAVTAVVSGPGTAATVTDVLAQQAVSIPDELWAELDALVPDQADLV
jgi:D-threo-aldose 1-dehydrogenase